MVAMIPSLGREDPLEQEMAKHSSILAWEIHGLGSVVGYSPQGCKELDMTEHVCTRTRLEPGPPGGSSDRQQGQDPWGRAYVAGTGTTEETQQLLELLLEAERGGETASSAGVQRISSGFYLNTGHTVHVHMLYMCTREETT